MTLRPDRDNDKKLVLLGDSIVYGWGVPRRQRYAEMLQELLDQDPHLCVWRVIAEGVPGDTAPQGVERFEQDVAHHNPDAVLLTFGLNDGALSRTAFDTMRERALLAQTSPRWRMWFRMRRVSRLGQKALGLDARQSSRVLREPSPRIRSHIFQLALRTLVRETRALQAEPILLDLVPRNEAVLSREQRNSYFTYGRLIAEVAQATDTAMIKLSRPSANLDAHQPDGVHLTPAGHRWLAEQIYTQLEQDLP